MGNPAMVLYGHFKQLPAQRAQSWPQAWKNILGLDWGEAVAPLLELEERTERIVKAQPDIDIAPLLLHRSAWRRAILLYGVDLSKSIQASGYELSETATSGLYTVALYIGGLPGTTPEAPDALDSLSRSVASLREDVIGLTDLAADLRAFLLEQVNNMQRRIDLSRVTGTGPIEDLRAETVGSAATRASMWQRAMESPARNKIIAVFVALNVYNGGVATLNQSIDGTEQLLHTVRAVAERVVGNPPQQIEAPSPGPGALPAGGSTVDGGPAAPE